MAWENQWSGTAWNDGPGWEASNWWSKAAWQQQSWDAVAELRSAGNAVDQLSPQQLEVARNLSPAEVAVLNSIKWRIDSAAQSGDGEDWSQGGDGGSWSQQSESGSWRNAPGWAAWDKWNNAAWEQQSWDAVAALRAAGAPVDQFSTEQLNAARNLSPAEVAMLNSIKWRIDWAAGGEVEGHSWNGLGIF